MGIPSLDITTPSYLGAMLVQASAYFQAGAAELIGAEGDKLQALVAAAGGSVSYTLLMTANSQIALTMAALSNLEGAILQKIAAATHLHVSGWTFT